MGGGVTLIITLFYNKVYYYIKD